MRTGIPNSSAVQETKKSLPRTASTRLVHGTPSSISVPSVRNVAPSNENVQAANRFNAAADISVDRSWR